LVFAFLSSGLLTAQTSTKPLTFVRTTKLSGGAVSSLIGRVQDTPEVDVTFDIPGVSGDNSLARLPAMYPSRQARRLAVAISPDLPGLISFFKRSSYSRIQSSRSGRPPADPRSHRMRSGDANGQLEPPDQRWAVGNGFVIEPVNNAIGIYDTAGNLLAFEALSSLFGVPPTFVLDAKGNVIGFGPFLSDPRAYFDSVNGHFFVTETEIDTDPSTGDFGNKGHIFIAVSESNNSLGNWNVYVLDVTNDGDARFGGCPTGCAGDQPLIGADANGFYISTNAFGLPPSTFRGAQLYVMSLSALESGPGCAITAIHFGDLSAAGLPARSIQPATVPPGGTPSPQAAAPSIS
jgi:hypothetical protein